MNSATANGLLGAGARTAVTTNTCSFTVQHARSFKDIRIQVRALSAAGLNAFERHCTDRTALRGLGNEAFACRVTGRRGTVTERIAGHVRNQAFVVEVSTNEPNAEFSALLSIAKQVAGQVAGNLF